MKEFFDQIKGSITDILNVGRLIFYPFAGILIVFPLYMIVRLLLAEPCETLSAQILIDLRHITNSSWSAASILFASSVVVGFLLATTGFSMVLEELGADVNKNVEQELLSMSSLSYNYPLLRQNKDEDYAGWLISEYYRYVEIAAYIPLGGIIGLVLLEAYVFLFLLRVSLVGFTGAHTTFLVILGALVLIKYYVWPEIWVKQVLKSVIRTYLRAKRDLIDGVKRMDKEVKEIASA